MKLATNVSSAPSAKEGGANWWTAAASVVVYAYLNFALVTWWLFLVPNHFLFQSVADLKMYSMDTAASSPSLVAALSQNFAAIMAFGFTHSLFARRSVKVWMGLPASIERSFYCLQAAFFLHMLQKYWVEVDSPSSAWIVWDLSASEILTTAILGIFWFGSAFLLSATFALDHFHLFGLSQGFGFDWNEALGLTPSKAARTSGVSTRWHYGLVAHPIMTGILINCWATPIMTPSRLFLALFMTSYIVAAVTKLEEPAVKEELGMPYEEYLKKTPRFVPASPYRIKLSIEKNVKEE